MKKIICSFLLPFYVFFLPANLLSENYLLNGGQKSKINYRLAQTITPTEKTVTMNLTYVQPENFNSVTYNQAISGFAIRFSIEPEKKKEWTDQHGNRIIDYEWQSPQETIEAEITFNAENSVTLEEVSSQSPFPLGTISEKEKPFLQATKMVPSGDETIRILSSEIVGEARTEIEAVHRILAWVIDRLNYVLDPEEFGALYSLTTGKGNCQNYSHLSAALMRAQGIPVRIVNGITLKKPYDIIVNEKILTLNMAQGRHSWIEVYFPDLGWMPFDPQQSELFVSNRFIRIEVGIDNEATSHDGLVRWTQKKGSKNSISFQEGIEAEFENDRITINGSIQNAGPRKLLLMPGIKSVPFPVVKQVTPKAEEPDPGSIADLKFEKPYIYGNLTFPRNVNFAFTRVQTKGADENSQELKKSFIVETAEYVSGKEDYAQIFVLDKPLYLGQIGLALQKFGGRGTLVVALCEDMDGRPGNIAARSVPVDLGKLRLGQGYDWVDFDFSQQGLILTPDKYWIMIEFGGSPIINWFYSYGKPVGPIEGTLMKLKNENKWTHTMGYEFNYRVVGKKGE